MVVAGQGGGEKTLDKGGSSELTLIWEVQAATAGGSYRAGGDR